MHNCEKIKTRGKITIEFTRECLMCEHEDDDCKNSDIVHCTIHPAEDGEISTNPEEFIGILTRLMSAAVIVSAGKDSMKDAYHTACHVSGFVAEEMQHFMEGEYTIKIHIPPSKPSVEA